MAKIRFVCTECGKESWFDINEETYVVSSTDLVCDDCNFPEEVDDSMLTENEKSLVKIGRD